MPRARKAGPLPGVQAQSPDGPPKVAENGRYRRAEKLTRQIRALELAFILGIRLRRGEAPPEPAVEPWGIALSGGGIRSATFSLGVLQALAENRLLRCFHYQSTISGGGYAGAFLQGLIRRMGFATAFDVLASHVGDEKLQRPILHLREYSNYLSPRKKLLSGDTLGMLGTYVRNVALIQIQLFALMVALSLVPLAISPGLSFLTQGHRYVICLIGAGMLGAIAAYLLKEISQQAGQLDELATHISNPLGGSPAEQPDKTILAQALWIVYLTTIAAILGALGLWPVFWTVPGGLDLKLSAWIAGAYFVVWLLWLACACGPLRQASTSPGKPLTRSAHPFRFFVATVLAALLAGFLLAALRVLLIRWFDANMLRTIIVGPSVVLAAVMLVGIVHVGLAGPGLTDLQREMWARVAGKTAATVLALGLALATVTYGPWLMLRIWGQAQTLHAAAWLSVATWVLTTGAGVLAAHGQKANGAKARITILEVVARVAPSVFLIGLLVATALVVHGFFWDNAYDRSSTEYLDDLAEVADGHRGRILEVLALALGVWGVFGRLVDVNEFSLNAFYRNRLVRCYLGATRRDHERHPEPTTNFDIHDDLSLADVVRGERWGEKKARPLYPLVGATLNLVDTKQLDWQDRKAASFLFSPGYCGYVPPPSHWELATAIGDKRGFSSLGEAGGSGDALPDAITLGSATAISGAAVSPNMGYHSSPVVTLLLTLFDARLGWWLPNPRLHPSKRRAPQMSFYGEWLIREMLGRTREESDFIYLSDGGHLENLGLYELIRRECEFILCVDSSADPDRCFADLGNAIQKCHTDFGVDIDIDVSDLRCGPEGLSRRSCAVGHIHYKHLAAGKGAGPGKTGILLYIKPSLTGREPADIACYASIHPDFPHESTADQYFDEKQFECYRRLGRDCATSALQRAIERARVETDAPGGFDLFESELKSSLLRELQYEWVAPLRGTEEHFSRHAHALAELFAKLRKDSSLSVLDGHLYPAWGDVVHSAPRPKPGQLTRLPDDKDFRACFYFCQELVQLMESVYHDLDLENAWQHPDNRGWLNAFRQWSWSPVFRIAWAAGSPMYGKRFVTFCEVRLGLPALEKREFTEMERYEVTPGRSWSAACQRLLDQRKINVLEYGILTSAVLAPLVAEGQASGKSSFILLLRLKWRSITVRHPCLLGNTTVGIAVMVGDTLHVLRIQDHLRKMGLATLFVDHIVRAGLAFGRVDIREGRYGEAATYSSVQAVNCAERLEAMRRRACPAESP